MIKHEMQTTGHPGAGHNSHLSRTENRAMTQHADAHKQVLSFWFEELDGKS